MFRETVDGFAAAAAGKKNLLFKNPVGYFIASMLAGIYVGLGILLIFSIGAPFAAAQSPAVKLIMGASFGVALTLVIFAGSELFTGNTMVMTFGWMDRTVKLADLALIWLLSWLGNLAGSLLLAYTAVKSGSVTHSLPFFAKVSAAKMTASPLELTLRGILCNLLVCLAVWMTARAKSDTAKVFLIFWCLFAFIGSGYEHSIANMTLLAVPLFGVPGAEGVTWGGYLYNMGWVTLGNTIAGAIVLAGAYRVIAGKPQTA